MRSRLYPSIRQDFLTGQFDWLNANPRAVLLAASFTPDFSSAFLNQLPIGAQVAHSEDVPLNPTAVNGIAGMDAPRFPLLFDNRIVSRAAIYDNTGDPATSRLVLFIGEDDLVSSPFVPFGFDYYIYPNIVEGGLFRI